MIKILKYSQVSNSEIFARVTPAADVEAAVSAILTDVRAWGDQAVLDYTRKFDAPQLDALPVSPEEIEEACRLSRDSGAHFVKTSTGFSKAGATFGDVALFKKHVAPHVKIKAAGGISSLEDAEKFIELGADRLGTSRIVKIAKGLENDGTY